MSRHQPERTGTHPVDTTPTETESVNSVESPTGARAYRRPLWTIILLLLVAAALLWGSSKLAWSWSVEQNPLRGKVVNVADGAVQAPALIPLALLAVAAIAAALATGGWLRRIVGALVTLAGIGMIAVALTHLSEMFGAHPNGYPLLQILAAHVLAALAGLLVVPAGLLLIRMADRLPRMGAKYETPGGTKRRRDPDAELWHALSEGDDPTARD